MPGLVRTVSRYLSAFVGLTALFCTLMYLACTFDSQLIENNVLAARDTLVEQGGFPTVLNALNVRNDNFTDAVMINEAYSVDSTEPFVSSLKVRKNYRSGYTVQASPELVGDAVNIIHDPQTGQEICTTDAFDPIVELDAFLAGDIHTSVNYGRYWHGYLCYLRPLLLLGNLNQIRLFLLVAYTGMLAYFLTLLYRRFGRDIAIIYGASLLSGGLLTASFSLQASGNFLTLMVCAIIYAKWMDKIKDAHLFIFAVACLTNFFDYLTAPLVSLGMLGSLHLLKLRQDGASWSSSCRQFLISCAVWLGGYVGTWFAKWIIYDIFINDGQSMVAIGLQQVVFRLGRTDCGEAPYNGKHIFITIAITGIATFFAAVTEGVLLYLHKFTLKMSGFNRQALPFLLLTPIPALWYIAAANHTVIHHFFTYRMATVYTLGLLLALQELLYGSTIAQVSAQTPLTGTTAQEMDKCSNSSSASANT